MKKIYKVYKLRNMQNNMLYFGYTGADTTLDRQKELYRHNKELHSDMLKYGLESFDKEDLLYTDDLKEALEYESKMIIENNTLWPNGYNHVVAARFKRQSELHHKRLSQSVSGQNNPMYGRKQTEDAKRKISEANRGRQWNEEQRRAHSERLRGRVFSQEHKDNLSKSNKLAWSNEDLRKALSDKLKGKEFSKEHCMNISKAKKGKKISDEHKKHISEGIKGIKRTEEQKKNYSKSASNRIWFTNGTVNKSSDINNTEKINSLKQAGFYRGFTNKRKIKSY